jgi:hypothetical protein
MNGTCLCGSVSFALTHPPEKLYQCHCSLCRKQSGSAANAAALVLSEHLSWVSGKELVSTYVKPTGFRSDFCSRCGSPVPNDIRGTLYVWVPAGLLEDTRKMQVAVHLSLASKASWEPPPTSGVFHENVPPFPEVLAALNLANGT